MAVFCSVLARRASTSQLPGRVVFEESKIKLMKTANEKNEELAPQSRKRPPVRQDRAAE